MKAPVLVLLAATLSAGAAQAQTAATATAPHAYVGIGVASAENRIVDAWKSDAKIFAGYQFDQTWGIEAGYTRFGRVGFSSPGQDFNLSGSTRGNSSYVAGTYSIPLNERVSAFGKLGLSYSQRRYASNAGSWSDNDTGLYGGLGLQYKLTEKVALTAEYERYGKKKTLGAKADVFTLGLKYGF